MWSSKDLIDWTEVKTDIDGGGQMPPMYEHSCATFKNKAFILGSDRDTDKTE